VITNDAAVVAKLATQLIAAEMSSSKDRGKYRSFDGEINFQSAVTDALRIIEETNRQLNSPKKS
jgi:hypothetical protein